MKKLISFIGLKMCCRYFYPPSNSCDYGITGFRICKSKNCPVWQKLKGGAK